jgi:hypothetical protein
MTGAEVVEVARIELGEARDPGLGAEGQEDLSQDLLVSGSPS